MFLSLLHTGSSQRANDWFSHAMSADCTSYCINILKQVWHIILVLCTISFFIHVEARVSDAHTIFQSTHRSKRFDVSTCTLTPLICQLTDAVLHFFKLRQQLATWSVNLRIAEWNAYRVSAFHVKCPHRYFTDKHGFQIFWYKYYDLIVLECRITQNCVSERHFWEGVTFWIYISVKQKITKQFFHRAIVRHIPKALL